MVPSTTPASDQMVTDQLADIIVRVLGCDAEDIVPVADLKNDLGADSLTIVEIGEELGRRFDLYLTDDTINALTTVQDAVRAVTRHDGSGPGRHDHRPVPKNFVAAPFPQAVESSAVESGAADYEDETDEGELLVGTTSDIHLLTGPIAPAEAERRAWAGVKWMAIVGLLVGGVVAFGFSALVGATGIDDVSLPPLPTASASATPTESTSTPTPAPTQTDDPTPEPTLTTENANPSPGERFVLRGQLPEAGEGAKLQVEVREPGTDWDDFPVVVTTREDGTFKTGLYTSRTGEREFRLINEKTGKTTPTVKVTIG